MELRCLCVLIYGSVCVFISAELNTTGTFFVRFYTLVHIMETKILLRVIQKYVVY